jgi:hypothetical protein
MQRELCGQAVISTVLRVEETGADQYASSHGTHGLTQHPVGTVDLVRTGIPRQSLLQSTTGNNQLSQLDPAGNKSKRFR